MIKTTITESAMTLEIPSAFLQEAVKEEKKRYRREKKFPPEQVRKRESYKWFEHMIQVIARNTPEDNLRLLHNQLCASGGFYTKKGALVRYKQESMELAIEDYKNKKQCNTLAQTGTLGTPTS